jgi:hypothetical protein
VSAVDCTVTFYDVGGQALEISPVADMSVRGAITFDIPKNAVRVELSLASGHGTLMAGLESWTP